jgi:hypothetical protein
MSAPPTTSTSCPACGASTPTGGKFCSSCGAGLTQHTCGRCQAELTLGARFCHRCGEPAGGAAGRRGNERTTWLVAGAICVVLVGAIVYKVTGGTKGPAVPDMANTGAAGGSSAGGGGTAGPGTGGGGQAPDISQMTPRERFDRLFNRIMQAAEQGNQAQVEQFTPMALGAYSQLDVIDADARYHAAVLQLQAGNAPAALALADTILVTSPGNLFGYIVRGMVAKTGDDKPALRQAQRDFLAHYDAAMQTKLAEYDEHRPVIDEFKRDADAGAR